MSERDFVKTWAEWGGVIMLGAFVGAVIGVVVLVPLSLLGWLP